MKESIKFLKNPVTNLKHDEYENAVQMRKNVNFSNKTAACEYLKTGIHSKSLSIIRRCIHKEHQIQFQSFGDELWEIGYGIFCVPFLNNFYKYCRI